MVRSPPDRECLGSSVLTYDVSGEGPAWGGRARAAWGWLLEVHLEAGVSRVGRRVDHVGKEGALTPLPSLGEGTACAYLAHVYFCGFLQHRAGATVVPRQCAP